MTSPGPTTHAEIKVWPPTLVLGDDVRVDYIGETAQFADGTALILLTGPNSGTIATLRVTPTAADALQSALIDYALRSPRVTARLMAMLDEPADPTDDTTPEENQT